jgi:hypothetical protein
MALVRDLRKVSGQSPETEWWGDHSGELLVPPQLDVIDEMENINGMPNESTERVAV